MTNDELIDALRRRIDRLESRVDALEDETPTTTTASHTDGLDHRDEAVLDYIRDTGKSGPRDVVKAYQRLTDVNREKTAIRRAKQLRRTTAFGDAVEAGENE